MTGRQKILQVLKDIKQESEINANPEWVEFKFNTSVFGAGILTDDQEKRILIKLEKERIVEIHLPNPEDVVQKATLSQYTPIEFMMQSNTIWIKILPSFYRKYFWYRLTSFGNNKWNIINPFWLLWQLIRGVVFLVEWLWDKSKVATLTLGTLGGLLVYDWSLAWRNLKPILIFLKILDN